MTVVFKGAIDCDVHAAVPNAKVLLPFLEPYWSEQVRTRGTDDLELAGTMATAPLGARPDWRPAAGKPAHSYELLREHLLEPFQTGVAICNVVWGAQAIQSVDFAAAMCRATNQWLAHEWLDRDPRLRASLVLPVQSPEKAAEEIEFWAHDKRFVQGLVLAGGDTLLGRRQMWPMYRAAERNKLPIGIHVGSTYRHATTPLGWPSTHTEEYVAHSGMIQGQLMSLIAEGVFTEFPELKVVLIEAGVSWLPAFMWRAEKGWRGIRMEVPWLSRGPAEIIRESVRLTIQPFDGPETKPDINRLLNQIGSDDVLLFSTDYPHWHFDGFDVMPEGLPADLVQKMTVTNPISTYSRLEGYRQ